MSVTVTCDVFSGRPNPRWTLDEPQIVQLAGKVQRAVAAPRLPPQQLPDGLGYRGLIVESDDPRVPSFRVYRHILARDDATFHAADDIESFLLSTGPPGLTTVTYNARNGL